MCHFTLKTECKYLTLHNKRYLILEVFAACKRAINEVSNDIFILKIDLDLKFLVFSLFIFYKLFAKSLANIRYLFCVASHNYVALLT